jgi:hypothetical protein
VSRDGVYPVGCGGVDDLSKIGMRRLQHDMSVVGHDGERLNSQENGAFTCISPMAGGMNPGKRRNIRYPLLFDRFAIRSHSQTNPDVN